MGRIVLPYSLKKRGKIYHYKLPHEKNFHSTGETVESRAKIYVQNILQEKIPARTELRLKKFAKDFFVWGKCNWIRKTHKKGRPFSESVAQQRRRHLEKYILPEFGNRKISTITTIEIEEWLMELELSNQTKNHILYSLRIIFREAKNLNVIKVDPCDSIDPFNIRPNKPDIFTKEERFMLFPEDENKLLEIWKDYFWASFFFILATTGLRPQEARALKWEDWNREYNILIINKAVKDIIGVGDTKTGKPKISILIDRAVEILTKWHQNAIYNSEDDSIYSSDKNRPITRRTYLRHFNDAIIKAEIEIKNRKLVPYSFRHTANTNYVTDFDDKIVQALMGHGNDMNKWYDNPEIMNLVKRAVTIKEKLQQQWLK